MITILRLQGLDVKAGTGDIRTFFKRLYIPDGGVYIVGGSLREAFIAVTVEKDAQLAMRYTGKFLKGSKVTLHISNMAELEKKLKLMLRKKKPSPTQLTVNKPQPSPNANMLPLNASTLDPKTKTLPQHLYPNTSNLQPSNAHSLDCNTVLQGLHLSRQSENNAAVPRVNGEARTPKQTLDSGPGYVRLFGLPASATKQDICQFFKGLIVQEVIVDVELGRSHACLVKFANTQDVHDALLFNQQSLGPICVEVRAATKKMWTSALQECETAVDVGERVKTKQSPLRETANHKQKNTSALQLKRQSTNRVPSKLPKRPDCDSTTLSPTTDYTVMVNNLPKGMTKTEIKELFRCPNIAHGNVLHLLDKECNRTDTAFLTFTCFEDYVYAMNLTGCHLGSVAIEVSSITIKTMRDMIDKTHPRSLEHCPKTDPRKKPNRKRKSDAVESPEEAPSTDPDPAAQTCLFVRNLPADIQERHVQMLFSTYKVGKDSIILLRDSDGDCIGEAVVQFKSQKLAILAQRLHGQNFLGSKVLLTLINVKQMEDILARNV
ncbi:RNA binding motif protein 12Ba [Cottoperca gobio]|uniref:RNA-binding protein 12B-like n=1 Tax=Cottoperca gobio TaxID=56716 RepID=A0A6J2RBA5_COTGO|nr:RNA-binding protein 12B-like [Cottoperca gobio]XP_029306570.1 RNA-binding protein 12B-like [Cottoperca gobio]